MGIGTQALVIFIGVIHKSRGQTFGHFWLSFPSVVTFTKSSSCYKIIIWLIPIKCPHGLWMNPYRRRNPKSFRFSQREISYCCNFTTCNKSEMVWKNMGPMNRWTFLQFATFLLLYVLYEKGGESSKCVNNVYEPFIYHVDWFLDFFLAPSPFVDHFTY